MHRGSPCQQITKTKNFADFQNKIWFNRIHGLKYLKFISFKNENYTLIYFFIPEPWRSLSVASILFMQEKKRTFLLDLRDPLVPNTWLHAHLTLVYSVAWCASRGLLLSALRYWSLSPVYCLRNYKSLI